MNLERYYGLVIDRAGLPEVPETPRRWAEQLDVPILPIRQGWYLAHGSTRYSFHTRVPSHITANGKRPITVTTPWGDLTRPPRKPIILWMEGDWYDYPELVLMHELGHAAIDDFNPMVTRTRRESELGAWEWAINAIQRPLHNTEQGRMFDALKSYGIYPACTTVGHLTDLLHLSEEVSEQC